MAVHFLELGGKERPVCLDQTLAYEYERTLGRSYLRDLNDLFVQIAQVGQAMSTNDVGTAAANLSVVTLVNFVYASMRLGCRRTSTSVDFDEYQVADWILGNQQAVSQFTVWLVEANVDTSVKEGDDSKKNANQ